MAGRRCHDELKHHPEGRWCFLISRMSDGVRERFQHFYFKRIAAKQGPQTEEVIAVIKAVVAKMLTQFMAATNLIKKNPNNVPL